MQLLALMMRVTWGSEFSLCLRTWPDPLRMRISVPRSSMSFLPRKNNGLGTRLEGLARKTTVPTKNLIYHHTEVATYCSHQVAGGCFVILLQVTGGTDEGAEVVISLVVVSVSCCH